MLWTPSEAIKEQATLTQFQRFVQNKTGDSFSSYQDFYAWSIDKNDLFWDFFWDFSNLTNASKGGAHQKKTIFQQGKRFEDSRFFPQGMLNYAENLLQGPDSADAIIFRGEDMDERRLTYRDLRQEVHYFQSALKEMGISSGDRVVAFIPNIPEAVIAMLATTSLGAIWSSCSPDFGVEGLLDRFCQVQPKLLITADGYRYKGKGHNSLEKIELVLASLPSVEQVIVIPYISVAPDISRLPHPNPHLYSDLVAETPVHALTFTSVPFDHPLFIMFSSGTTGKPKCIVHGHGGTLLQHLKEHRLHCDIKQGSRFFYYTTTSWMMWNWLVSGLASQATILLYDGSPFYPGPEALWDYAGQERCTHFGTSAKYIDALEKTNFSIRNASDSYAHSYADLRMILSTGSPLLTGHFDYVYQEIAADICLASISGGTDILSCFALGNITEPVYRGELQTRGLGMAVDVFDEAGQSVRGRKGELVCTKPFPSMPIGFWHDSEGEKYHSAYFSRFPNVWHHGDFVELTEHNGLIIYGRSDTVLNPGGVRIGTAEIYRQITSFKEIEESLVIGQQWQEDVRVVLFVKLQPGFVLDEKLKSAIRQQIQEKTTPRHVPSKIIAIADIPRTVSGKSVELAVSNVIHERSVHNISALANPEALDFYRDLPELQD